jgi:two-component system, cell cycle sensor histidine kinase and response regulator CckA
MEKKEKLLSVRLSVLKSIIDMIPEMISVVDREFNILLANDRVIRQFGHSDESEVIGQKCYRIRKRHDGVCPECGIARAFETGQTWTRLSTPEEEAQMGIVAKAYALPLIDENGEIWGGIEAIADITDLSMKVETLERSEVKLRYFKFAVDASSSAVAMFTAEGKHWYQNRAFDEMFGGNGRDASTTIYVDEPMGRRILKTVTTEGEWSGEVEMYGKNGEVLPILLNANAIRDEKEEVVGFIAVHTDLRDRRQAEAERQKLERHLHRAQKLESLGVLAGGIAHDFNNLLGGIFGFIELALLSTENPEVSQYLAKSVGAIDRAKELTRQLLTFSKGGVPIKKVQLLFPFIKESAEFALSGSKCSCEFDVPDDLWTCDYDREQIGQVVDNLILNAIQSMPTGGHIYISARNHPAEAARNQLLSPKSYIKISVRDTGVGIAPEALPNIFDPFFTTKQIGSGLGLSTCYSIVSRHEGHIEVASEQGKGTVVDIYLPASQKDVRKEKPASKNAKQRALRILVMDDEEMIREYMAAICNSLGYDVVIVQNGEEAVQRFIVESKGDHPFKGVILDLTVPGAGMGGKEALFEIRKLDSDVPVFVASGYADDPVIAFPEKYGFTGSISKPFQRHELENLLRRYLS